MSILININNLEYSYADNSSFGMTIKSFNFKKGERLLIYGESGLGKSTFLNLISGAIQPKEGKIEILGKDISHMSSYAKDKIRGDHFGIVFQTFNLLPYISVEKNILMGLVFSKRKKDKVHNISNAIKNLMKNLSLDYDELKNRNSYELSIGQQQRVAVARALIGNPEIILADEPTSALDMENQKLFLDLLFESMDKKEQGLVLVSHKKDISKNFTTVKNINDICELKNV
tara:strand:- start:628 stop:1317 length:690 start_codon:yes stop_codon:yes gene_type:complete